VVAAGVVVVVATGVVAVCAWASVGARSRTDGTTARDVVERSALATFMPGA
jgi:hypothetical protein